MSELSPSRARRIAALVLVVVYAAVIFGGSSGPAPETITNLELPDFLLHAIQYAGLGFLLARWLWLARRRLDTALLVLLPAAIATLYGVTDEIHQSFVPERDASALDVVADAVGAVIGAAAYRLFLAGLLRRSAGVTVALVLLAGVAVAGSAEVDKAAETITVRELTASAELLAAPELEGRDTPSRGLDVAARFLASRFESYGLEPGAKDGTWFQEIPLTFRTDIGKSFVRILTKGGERTWDGENVAFDRSSPDAVAGGPVCFAGYGITSRTVKWDDYAGIDVKGKVVVVFESSPAYVDRKHALARDRRAWALASISGKVRAARDRGAVALLLVRSPRHGTVDRLRLMDGSTREGKVEETADGWRLTRPARRREYISPGELERLVLGDGREVVPERAGDRIPVTVKTEVLSFRRDEVAWVERGVVALPAPPGARRLLRSGKKPAGEFPVASISAAAAEAILGRKLADLAKEALAGGAGHDVEGPAVVVGVTTGIEKGVARNVIARCPGRARKDEAIILTAHYDHVGTGRSGEIYHGADDNASGTAVLLAVARAFAALPERPERPVWFVAVAGEEKGFLGSQPFVDDPPLPLDSILVNLNMDMVGRGAADEIRVMVGGIGTNLAEVLKACEAAARIRPKYEILEPVDGKLPPLTGREKVSLSVPRSRYFGRSDQVVFYRKGIPAAFLFGGTHADYHRPTDTIDKLVYERMARVGRFVFRAAHALSVKGLSR